MNLITNCTYQVKQDHTFHPNRFGKFRFLGGPDRDCIVLSDINDTHRLFAVGLHDLVDFHPERDAVINTRIFD